MGVAPPINNAQVELAQTGDVPPFAKHCGRGGVWRRAYENTVHLRVILASRNRCRRLHLAKNLMKNQREEAMPFYETGNVRILYEEAGSGFPLFIIYGGGLDSAGVSHPHAPFNAMEEFKSDYRCITMDLRHSNHGKTTGPLEIDRPWDAHTDDQLALLDDLGVDNFHCYRDRLHRVGSNWAVFAKNSPLAMTICALHRLEMPHADAVSTLRASAGNLMASNLLSRVMTSPSLFKLYASLLD